MAKLTKAQRTCILRLQDGAASAYTMRVSLGTLNALWRKGLVGREERPGHMVNPRVTHWRLTEPGRAALKETLG